MPWELGEGVASWVQGDEEPVLSYVALIADSAGIRRFSLKGGARHTPEDLALLVRTAAAYPLSAAPPARPSILHVADDRLAHALREMVSDLPMQVAAGPTLEVQEALRWFRIHLGNQESSPFLSACAPAEVAACFDAAERFYAARPWQRFAADTYVAMRVNDGPWAFLNVMGHNEQEPGIVFFADWLAVCRFVANLDLEATLGLPGNPDRLVAAAAGLEAMTLCPLYALHPEDADLVLRLGCRPVRDALYPLPHRYEAEPFVPLPPRFPLATYTLALESIVKVLAGQPGRRIRKVEVAYDLRGTRVELRYPARGDEDAPADSGRYRVTVLRKRGKAIGIEAGGDCTLADLACELGLFHTRSLVRGFGQGQSCLWQNVGGLSGPCPRLYHLRDLEAMWVEIGASRHALQITPASS
ncbi:MAG: hypothetical protein HY660_11965 [Armatimonadetes bacterium]|nr:hypothetical protein [Armatimonadota bacterium]